jgi:hypothetical protein
MNDRTASNGSVDFRFQHRIFLTHLEALEEAQTDADREYLLQGATRELVNSGIKGALTLLMSVHELWGDAAPDITKELLDRLADTRIEF